MSEWTNQRTLSLKVSPFPSPPCDKKLPLSLPTLPHILMGHPGPQHTGS